MMNEIVKSGSLVLLKYIFTMSIRVGNYFEMMKSETILNHH